MSDYYEELERARARLQLMVEELRQVERGDREPLGPVTSGLYADWCESIAQVLKGL